MRIPIVIILLISSLLLHSTLLCSPTNLTTAPLHIIVDIAQQRMLVMRSQRIIKSYPISTSGTGIGNTIDSNKTPLGKHRICAKIGATAHKRAPRGTIFKATINTHKIARIYHRPIPAQKQEDLITTRIIQLTGLENRNSNSFKRGIWLHGTPYEGDIGTPCSHGCVRMRNADIEELFDLVPIGTIIEIV